jgi:hypothetical protein
LDPAARDLRLRAAFCLLLLLALALRVVAAMGEPWLDEIWSLHLIGQMRRGEVLSSLATDNNHYLNTLYLWLVGPDAPPLVLRALSILLGTAGVAAAGWLQRKRGTATMLATMAMLAASYPMVNAGSEARGYAGMMLCALLSIGLTERALEEHSAKPGLRLGLSNVIGVLFQPLMVAVIGSLGLWTLCVTWREQRSLRASYEVARDLFAWTIRLLLPVVLLIGAAVHFGGGYVLGGATPFSASFMLDGFARLFRFLLGLPESFSDFVVVAIVLACTILAVALNRTNGHINNRAALYVIMLVAPPAAMAMARLPNVYVPRCYLLPGLALLLLLGDLYASLARRGPVMRSIAAVALTAMLLGNAVALRHAIAVGRGATAQMLQTIVDQGGGPLTSNMPRDTPVLDYFIARNGGPVRFVAFADLCKDRPRWILTSDSRPLPASVTLGGPDCALMFERQAMFEPWGLSGTQWTLYRGD